MDEMKKDDFGRILLLGKEWEVMLVEVSHDKEQVDVFVGPKERGQMFGCPCCGKACKVHDYRERTWRSLDVGAYKCIVHAGLPRTDCPKCGVKQAIPDWAREYSRYTLAFERRCIEMIRDMPVAVAARLMRMDDESLWHMLEHFVEIAMSDADMSGVRRVGMDETARQKGHRYITIFADMDTGNVLFATAGKDSETIARFADHLEAHGGKKENITALCSDMSQAFISGAKAVFPEAKMTFDKFHVMKLAGDAVDDVRREENAKNAALVNKRYLLLSNPRNLDPDKRLEVEQLLKDNSRMMMAYGLRESLRTMYDLDRRSFAERHMEIWFRAAENSLIPQVKKLAATIRIHLDGILEWHDSKLTTGVLEGLNSIIQTAKRMARGYRNPKNMITMVYLKAAGIHL